MQQKQNIKVLLVEDHNLVREAFRFMLIDLGISDIIETDNGEDAVEIAKTQKPSLVLMDLMLPGIDGMETSRLIKEFDKDIKILGVTIYSDRQMLKRAVESGVDGLLLKSSEAADLKKAIETVMNGEKYVDSKSADILFGIIRDEENKTLLTEKEIEILKFAADGLANKEIAHEMGLALYTVKDYWKNIFMKLGANDRAHAVSAAFRKKIIE